MAPEDYLATSGIKLFTFILNVSVDLAILPVLFVLYMVMELGGKIALLWGGTCEISCFPLLLGHPKS